MSNFQEPKKQSEFATDIFIDFLMLNDYVGKMKIEMIMVYTELTMKNYKYRLKPIWELIISQFF